MFDLKSKIFNLSLYNPEPNRVQVSHDGFESVWRRANQIGGRGAI